MLNIGELKAAVAGYPDDMPVAVLGQGIHDGSELDTDVAVDTAINHPGCYPHGRASWHWESDNTVDTPGTPTVVIY